MGSGWVDGGLARHSTIKEMGPAISLLRMKLWSRCFGVGAENQYRWGSSASATE